MNLAPSHHEAHKDNAYLISGEEILTKGGFNKKQTQAQIIFFKKMFEENKAELNSLKKAYKKKSLEIEIFKIRGKVEKSKSALDACLPS